MKSFDAPYDRFTVFLTTFLLILMLGLPAFILLQTKGEGPTEGFLILGLVSLIIFSVVIFTFLTRPLAYQIQDGLLTIQSGIRSPKFKISEIAEVKIPQSDEMGFSIRTFGNGGLFGYTGFYQNSTFGEVEMFATRRNQYLVIRMKSGKTIVLTPDRPKEMMAALGF